MVNIFNFLSTVANFVSFVMVFMLVCFEHRVIKKQPDITRVYFSMRSMRKK